jgi:hypothetical protein
LEEERKGNSKREMKRTFNVKPSSRGRMLLVFKNSFNALPHAQKKRYCESIDRKGKETWKELGVGDDSLKLIFDEYNWKGRNKHPNTGKMEGDPDKSKSCNSPLTDRLRN